ncbi:MAG: MoxR family ATPase [Saprospiraceae bacterium]|nr:MoxR family ATPase [Saprospiraceae bacterium]
MSFNLYSKDGGQREVPSFEYNARLSDPSLYKPSTDLVDAVNVALALGQPLLLTGEPGTGKTQLAHHIAWFFKLGKPLIFNAQTTSTASELFYKYDALSHFQYSQNNAEVLSPDELESRFIRYVGLGAAIRADKRQIVLIDEIDKAPRDLPNDVLAAIEDLEFSVPEIGKIYKTKMENRPIIVITSNSEKNLPDPFLRRVVYFHIPFPDAGALLEIVSGKVDGYSPSQLQPIIRHFENIRNSKDLKLKKLPATAELIFWTMLLKKLDFDPNKLDNLSRLNAAEKQELRLSYSVLAKTKEDLIGLQETLR